jgi:LysR family transcriptional regulator, nitrogen assimilation regulatory protein
METRQLKYFLAIAEHGSFSLAAQRIGVAQPALSAQIAKLEGVLGCRLFRRHARGVELTTSGRQLHPQARDIWQRIRSAEADMRAGCEVREVTLGIPTLMSLLLVAPLVERVASVPGMTLRIREGMGKALREMLSSDKLDMALVYDTPGDDFHDSQFLCEETLAIVGAAHRTAVWRKSMANEGLGSIPLVLSTPGNSHRLILEEFAQSQRMRLNVVAEVDSLTGQRDLVMRGVGAAVLPRAACNDWPRKGLGIIRIPGEPLVSRVTLVRSQNREHGKTLVALGTLVQDVVGDLVNSGRWSGARLACS